jgi:cystathionine beta-lyase family protein involved in aluminum resistance
MSSGRLLTPVPQVWEEARRLKDAFADIDVELVAANMQRVQEAMRRARIGPHHFAGSTGYGHGDLGRAALDEVFTSAFQRSKWSLLRLTPAPLQQSRGPSVRDSDELLRRSWPT